MARTLTLTCLFSIASGWLPFVAADESAEPPLKYTVTVGEQVVTVVAGETVQLDGIFTDPRITLTPDPQRLFAFAGITFKYPRSYVFEADLDDPAAKSWTLSGNDFTIMVFVLKASLKTGDFAEDMLDQFGRENAQVTNANAKITLGEQQLSGTTLQITVATQKMVIDVFQIPSIGAETKLLVLQDNLDDAGNPSNEGRRTLADIKSSYTVER